MLTKILWQSRKRGITLPYKVRPKKISVRLFFVLMLDIKFQVRSLSGSLVFTANNIARLVESKKGHNLVNISRNSLKSLTDHLNLNLKSYAKYQNPSSSGSQDIVLTRFFHSYNGIFEKGA